MSEDDESTRWVVGKGTTQRQGKTTKGAGHYSDQESIPFWVTPAKGTRSKFFDLRLSHIRFMGSDKQEIDLRLWRNDAHVNENGPTSRGVRLAWEQARELHSQLGLLLSSEADAAAGIINNPDS